MIIPLVRASLVAALVASCLAACAEPAARGSAVDPSPPDGLGCSKVDSKVTNALRGKPEGTRVRVAVDLSTAPRARDVLQAGVADCVSSPSMGAGGNLAGGLPWGAQEISLPSALPVLCVGWASLAQIARWCNDPSVRSVDALD